MLHLPVTLATAGILGILPFILSACFVQLRAGDISLGDGGNPDMLVRIRAQANFAEYVPMILILMALAEAGGGNTLLLEIAGAVAVLARIFHAIDMPMKAPSPFRALGAVGTFLVVLALSGYSLYLATT